MLTIAHSLACVALPAFVLAYCARALWRHLVGPLARRRFSASACSIAESFTIGAFIVAVVLAVRSGLAAVL